MRFVSEFRDADLARGLSDGLAALVESGRRYRFMEFCGGHTHAIARYGIEDLLPPGIEMIHGPGCPVCVLPMGRIDEAIELAKRPEVILCTYADVLRVPGSRRQSLLDAKAAGADVRTVFSTLEVPPIAAANPTRQIVFFAIGFETTTPATAVLVLAAKERGLANLSVYSNHVLTPQAIRGLLSSPDLAHPGPARLDGIVGPAHVSAVIGSRPFEKITEEFRIPVVIAGFEPLDVLQAILMLVRQVNRGRCEMENEYTRVVTPEGNRKAQGLVARVFEVRDEFDWRGLGRIPASALQLKEAFAGFDAERRFTITVQDRPDLKSCHCGAILRGLERPPDCPLFGTACRPETPFGSCMVSPEGACAAHWTYRRGHETVAPNAA